MAQSAHYLESGLWVCGVFEHGCMDAWVCGVFEHGCMDAFGCLSMDAWMHGCMGLRRV